MYQAGRASVPSPARWKALAATLALTQALLLLFVIAQPTTQQESSSATEPVPRWTAEEPAGDWTQRQQLLRTSNELPEITGQTDLVPDEPPLRVFTSLDSITFE